MAVILTVWVDNDGCPTYVRDLAIRSAMGSSPDKPMTVTFVGNSYMHLPKRDSLRFVVVSGKFDAADQHIIDHVKAGELVVTGDVPLAYAVVKKGAVVINTRGEEINDENAGERLASRNLMTEMRDPMMPGGGPRPIGQQDIKRFADKWQALLHRLRTTDLAGG